MCQRVRGSISAPARRQSLRYATQPTVQKQNQIFKFESSSGRRRKAHVLFSYSAFHETLDSRTFHVLTIRANNKILGSSMTRDLPASSACLHLST